MKITLLKLKKITELDCDGSFSISTIENNKLNIVFYNGRVYRYYFFKNRKWKHDYKDGGFITKYLDIIKDILNDKNL